MSTVPATKPSKIRCAIYIRVSTEEQVERARLRNKQNNPTRRGTGSACP